MEATTNKKFDFSSEQLRYLTSRMSVEETNKLKYESGVLIAKRYFLRVIPETTLAYLAFFGFFYAIPAIRRQYGNTFFSFANTYYHSHKKISNYVLLSCMLTVGVYNIPLYKEEVKPVYAKYFNKVNWFSFFLIIYFVHV